MVEESERSHSRNNLAELRVQPESVYYHNEPPPPYSQSPPTPQTTADHQQYIQQTIIIQPPLKHGPMYYNCPVCQERVFTKVEHINSRKTHMLAGFICGFTFWCLLCCLAAVPYLVPTFKKSEHYCPNCNTFLGAYSRL